MYAWPRLSLYPTFPCNEQVPPEQHPQLELEINKAIGRSKYVKLPYVALSIFHTAPHVALPSSITPHADAPCAATSLAALAAMLSVSSTLLSPSHHPGGAPACLPAYYGRYVELQHNPDGQETIGFKKINFEHVIGQLPLFSCCPVSQPVSLHALSQRCHEACF